MKTTRCTIRKMRYNYKDNKIPRVVKEKEERKMRQKRKPPKERRVREKFREFLQSDIRMLQLSIIFLTIALDLLLIKVYW